MRVPYAEEEDEIIKQLWPNPDVTIDDILKVLKTRSKQGIEHRARRLGFGPKTRRAPQIDYEYLRKLQEVVEG